ncbi:MAG: hypothetical protein U0670_12825 [Anaerolineae bacterium]
MASDDDAGAAVGMDADSALLNGIPLPLDGEYAVQVIGGGGTGTYALMLERNAPLPIMTAAPPTATPIVNIGAESIPAEDGSRLAERVPISGEISRAGNWIAISSRRTRAMRSQCWCACQMDRGCARCWKSMIWMGR